MRRTTLIQRVQNGWPIELAAETPVGPRGRRVHKQPDAIVDGTTPFERDFTARVFVHEYPRGATREVVGAAFGISRQAVRAIEIAALAKLRPRMLLVGLSAADVSERVTLWDEIAAIDRMEAA
jgi:hypothetical protein